MLELNKVHVMDCRVGLAQVPKKSFHCCITSPPYPWVRDYESEPLIWDEDPDCEHSWGELSESHNVRAETISGKTRTTERHYGSPSRRFDGNHQKHKAGQFCSKCGAWRGQLGLEPTIDLYIKHLCDIFDLVKETLRDDGTCWVNLGDCYDDNKGLVQAPFRFSLEMYNRGWILRSVVVWHKSNAMPESCKDRPSIAHEYLFMFVKDRKYYFDWDAVKVKASENTNSRGTGSNPKAAEPGQGIRQNSDFNKHLVEIVEYRNIRTVWKIPTKPCPEAHFAVFPSDLLEIPIKASCPKLVCKKCGAPKGQTVLKSKNKSAFNIRVRDVKKGRMKYADRTTYGDEVKNYNEDEYTSKEKEIVIAKGCDCAAGFEPGRVIDPFVGTGTVPMVARYYGRDSIGFDLKDEYVEMAWKRIKPHMDQKKLFEGDW